MCEFLRVLLVVLVCDSVVLQETAGYFGGSTEGTESPKSRTEHAGGTIVSDKVVFSKTKSPYWLRNDIIVERDAELIIEPGVVIYVEPQVGITVRGVLTAVGYENERIILTTAEEAAAKNINFPDIRLSDGPTILAGRVQLRQNGQWRSVCTNSKNWTIADMETACRQLGFQGGSFFNWFDRQMPLKPRLLYEDPKCIGTEGTLFDCQWSSRQLGSGVCDYHPDLGIQCAPRHDKPLPFWRGIKFEDAKYNSVLTSYNTLYVATSLSKLQYVHVLYAGAGRNQNTTSAIEVHGLPPLMSNLEVLSSAFNGVNITHPDGPFSINNCIIRGNRGYGVFVNSSYGLSHIDGCTINENGADGIRYVHAEERPDERSDRFGYNDFCNLASVSRQIFPLQLYAEQTIFSNQDRHCDREFTTRPGSVITLTILRAVTNVNDSSTIEVYDGSNFNHRLITQFSIRNNTRSQSLTSTTHQIVIKFRAQPRTNTVLFMRLLSGVTKSYDLNVSHSDISDNLGRGIAVDNLRSQVHIFKSSVSKNQHVAGVHITSGVGDVNITESRISFNEGDGVNITYTGGSRNISKSSISSNAGYGIAIWLNNTRKTEFILANQTTVVQYSAIYKNLETGVLHGNYCGPSFLNFTGNSFNSSVGDALEILSCWRVTNESAVVQIGYNEFIGNNRIALRITPALNLNARIEYNHFRQGTFGALLIKNKPLEEFNILKTKITVIQNYFNNNSGTYVVNLALSPYSAVQSMLFMRNFVKNNRITEPFQPEDGSSSKLNPRSRVAAPIVVGSNNIDVFRNIIENPESKYEIGSHLEDQSKSINCTFNWLGFSRDEDVFPRLFHRFDRYNLAKLNFIPFLIHNSNPLTTKTNQYLLYVPKFSVANSDKVGGEVEGEETLHRGEYIVERDINIRPGGKLTLEPGVTLRFPPSVGMMVGGKLEARGTEPDSIKLTLKEEVVYDTENTTFETETEILPSETEMIPMESKVPIRLLGGSSETEGRLQVKINKEWGTVCNYGWTVTNAALVCQQLGYVLNPDDWFLERNEIPEAGTSEPIILSNVQCDDFDLDVTKCRAETKANFENSCSHENDVGVRCYKTSWAGVRFGALSERSNIQYITIENSGLLDYATSTFKPALQLDFARHNFENIKISNNFHHGLGVLYADIFTGDTVNIIKSSEFSNNRGAGISFKQLGFSIQGSSIENNFMGIEHNPTLTGLQQRELAGWFSTVEEGAFYRPLMVPFTSDQSEVRLQQGETKYFVTSKVTGDSIRRSYKISSNPGWVVGIQLLNPIENRSTEAITIQDAISYNRQSASWVLKRDLTVFPTTSSSHGIILDYESGSYAIGGTVIVISTIRAPVQNVYKRIVKGPVPTVTVKSTKIRNNQFGVHISYYNRYLNELGDHFLRKANETLQFINCEISHNEKEAIFIHTPHWDLHRSNISETIIMVNSSLITDNSKGIYHFSRDMRASNNIFHYILQDASIERNKAGGFIVNLPYVWQYNENFTHSVYMDNNTWSGNKDFGFNIDGHFAVVNITRNNFMDNVCNTGLMSIGGMEKKLLISGNKFLRNNGRYIVEFISNSQSEIIGEVPARFTYNELRNNRYNTMNRGLGILQLLEDPTSVVAFRGIQKVSIRRNLFSGNTLSYQLIAGIQTAKINNYVNVQENWWGSSIEAEIRHKIFDFDDWNNHAIADFRPFLLNDDFNASYSVSFTTNATADLESLGGRLTTDLVIPRRDAPYIVRSDITVMPKVTLTIDPGVVLEFAPNVGILVLGTLKAQAYQGNEIVMRPVTKLEHLMEDPTIPIRRKRDTESMIGAESIRLCKGRSCSEEDERMPREGFLEYFNKTTLQWIPMCDPRFTERNAQVVCRELGFDTINAFFDFDVRIEFHSNSLSRIWTWPEPLQCKGTEKKYENCPIRLNGQQFGHRHRCRWNSKFVFIRCGEKNLDSQEYWGGVRFANPEFEQQLYIHRLHDVATHSTLQSQESVMEYVNVIGAGILHNEKSPAVQSIIKSPRINFVTISQSAADGINLISPSNTMNLFYNTVQDSLGVGVNILSATGEGRESDESSFVPLKNLNIPYNLFSLVDICDTHKEIRIDERVLLYFKYDNHPVNCIKIFKSTYNIKPLGFRLLQFNLFNSTAKYGIPDFISLYDGDIYNVTSNLIDQITMHSHNERRLFRTSLPSLSIKLFANGASSNHGFIAEVVTLPISAIGFNRDVQHNISYSVVSNNRKGALLYTSAGEVNPIITIDKNQFEDNCEKLYGNFTTCDSALEIDIQNTQTIFFRNNLVNRNQGGLSIKADSRGSATSLKGYIHNNLFVNNTNLPVLYVEGRQSSPYQEVIIYRNYFTRNSARYFNNIVLKQVVSNFTWNYVKRNVGLQNLEISGFDKVRLPIYQTTTHNGFYNNYAVHLESRSTIVAGTAGQQYVDNIFFNPDNDYEMITVNRSLTLQLWNTKIDAAYNYWGLNSSLAVRGRIKDQSDDQRLLEVTYVPYYMNNQSVLLNKKCPPGWDLVGGTCYIYIGAPMTFHEARAFCQADNASMPYLLGSLNYIDLYEFLRSQQQWYLYSDRVWVQHIDRINECTLFAYQRVETSSDCNMKNPFICEIDPKVSIRIMPLVDDVVTISVISSIALAIILIGIVAVCWWHKSKYRKAQRLERRNSIRQSLHSLRSVGLAPGSFSDASYRRKAAQLSSRSTDTLTKNSDYKKMLTTEGSVDSMEKSTYTSSIEDTQSYDIYEAHNPNPSAFTYSPTIEYHKSPSRFGGNQYAKPNGFELAYKNEGFRDNSTFATNSNYQSRAESVQDDETPIIQDNGGTTSVSYPPSEYYNTDTLPLSATSGKSDSTLDLKKGIEDVNKNRNYDPIYSRDRPNASLLNELKNKFPKNPPTPPQPPIQSPSYSEKLESLQYSPDLLGEPQRPVVLETDFDEPQPKSRARAKSEVLLETNFDYTPPGGSPHLNQPISEYNRSKSQPLETAM